MLKDKRFTLAQCQKFQSVYVSLQQDGIVEGRAVLKAAHLMMTRSREKGEAQREPFQVSPPQTSPLTSPTYKQHISYGPLVDHAMIQSPSKHIKFREPF